MCPMTQFCIPDYLNLPHDLPFERQIHSGLSVQMAIILYG